MLTSHDVQLLRGLGGTGELRFEGRLQGDVLDRGVLISDQDRARWRVDEGLAHLFEEAEVRGLDRTMRVIYDLFPRFHDPGVRYALPMYGGGTEREIREGFMPQLALGALEARPDRPVRILEVGVGTGANLGLLLRDVPAGVPVEVWGMDLSAGMLSLCRHRIEKKRMKSPDGTHIRLLLADAHALPFPDDAFDRVFHVGGIAGFRDPSLAMKEMARVARPDTPIVVVDEALDPDRRNNAYHRLMFRMLTAYDPDPHVPREHVPYEAQVIADEQVSRFYYCLAFSVPAVNKR